MKFQPDQLAGTNAISRIEPGRLWVGNAAYAHSLVVPWRGELADWGAAAVADLTPEHFARLAALRPEVVIFGSGLRIRFPSPPLIRALIEARIGIETMDTAAAARTYNLLAAEGRTVVGALLIEAPRASL